jgi:hypothetical protein
MSLEHLYHYSLDQPEYRPTRLDIVGGVGISTYPRGEEEGGRRGVRIYSGAAEVDLSAVEPAYDSILVVGGSKRPFSGSKSASTVDSRLIDLFSSLDHSAGRIFMTTECPKTRSGKCKHSNTSTRLRGRTRRGSGQAGTGDQAGTDGRTTTGGGYPAVRFSDVTDEILGYCPGGEDCGESGSDTEGSENSESSESSKDTTSPRGGGEDDNIADDSDDSAFCAELLLSDGANIEEINDCIGEEADSDITQYLK